MLVKVFSSRKKASLCCKSGGQEKKRGKRVGELHNQQASMNQQAIVTTNKRGKGDTFHKRRKQNDTIHWLRGNITKKKAREGQQKDRVPSSARAINVTSMISKGAILKGVGKYREGLGNRSYNSRESGAAPEVGRD